MDRMEATDMKALIFFKQCLVSLKTNSNSLNNLRATNLIMVSFQQNGYVLINWNSYNRYF